MFDEFFYSHLDEHIAEVLKVVDEVIAKRKATPNPSPCCGSPSVELFSLQPPVGRTGIRRCLACDRVYDPTFKDVHYPNPFDLEG